MRIYKPTNFEYNKVWVPDGNYKSEIISISDVIGTIDYNQNPKESIIFTHNVNVKNRNYELPQFISAIVSKGSKDYKNSMLYDVLDMTGLIEGFYQEYDKGHTDINKWAVDYLRKNIIHKKCDATVKTIKKNTPEKYSVVHKIQEVK